MARRNYSSTAQSTTLTADITNVATSVVVAAVTGWPASTPYTIVVDEDLSSQEVMLVTARAGTTLTVTRAYGGTTGVSHTAGATVRHGHYSGDFDEANSFLNLGGTVGGAVTVSGAVAGTSGTFSAGVSGTTGTFSGAVSGTTGTFSGVVAHPMGAVGAPSVTFSGDSNTGIYSSAADNIALVTGGVSRLAIDSAGLVTGTGTSMGAWTSYTPTVGGTGWAIGNGSITAAKYCQVGKTVHFFADINFSTTSTFGSTAMTISLPVTASTAARLGIGLASDTSATTKYTIVTDQLNTTSVQLLAVNSAAGALTPVISTAPFTWANGDSIKISGTYEAA